MIKVVSVEQMRQIEAAADAAGISYAEMMENAGKAVALRVLDILAATPRSGGSARHPADRSRQQRRRWSGRRARDRRAERRAGALLPAHAARDDDPHLKAISDKGLFIAYAEDDQRFRVLVNMVASAHVVVDALFGIGVQLPLRDNVTKVLRAVQQAIDEEDDSGDRSPDAA